jgi:hypothetical protein
VEVYEGNYSGARRRRGGEAGDGPGEEPEPAAALPALPASPAEAAAPGRGALSREESRRRRSERQKLRNRLTRLEDQIAVLEKRLTELNEELTADPAGDWERIHRLANQEQEVRARLERRYAEWERVSTRLEKEFGQEPGRGAGKRRTDGAA